MRIEIDMPACAGHGQCAATAPEVYEIDDEGFVLPVAAVPAHAAEDAHAGAAACPEQAITVVD